jgi:hypothetical protein
MELRLASTSIGNTEILIISSEGVKVDDDVVRALVGPCRISSTMPL